MSLSPGRTLRALPTVLKISFAEAVAYRAEMFVWVLATTMPLISLALWTAVARDQPVVAQSTGKAYGTAEFTGYFLAVFIVRQLTSAWAAWQINFEVRTGTMAMRLLKPFHPMLSFAAENIAAIPMRLVVAIPVAVIALLLVGPKVLPHDPALWGIWVLAMVGAWSISFLSNIAIGCLAFFMQSSTKVMDVWLAVSFVFSGYLFPLDFLPLWMRNATNALPFRYQIGFPVELMTSMHDRAGALVLLGRQWAFVALLLALTSLLWRRGLRRFSAFGG